MTNTILVYEPGGSMKWYRYDDIVHQYPTTIAKTGSMERVKAGRDNPRNATYESSITWDIATGTKTSEKDINGNEMRYVYDAQQRLTEVRSPYDEEGGIPAVRYSYHTPAGGFWYAVTENKVVTDAHNTEVIRTFIQTDGLGRAIISAKTGCTFDSEKKVKTVGWNVGGAVSYDAKGRTIAEGQPYFIAGESIEAVNLNGKDDKKQAELYQLIRPTEKAYDALDRIVRTVLHGGSYDEYTGTGKRVQKVRYGITDDGLSYTETTDPKGNVGVQYADARGNIVKVERYSKKDTAHPLTSATYEYDTLGQMTAAYDAARNPITVTYDMLGRKTELTTKDGGAKRYTYDELHLLYEDDSVLRESGQRIDYTYDGFNRVVKIVYPQGGDVEYEYGIPKAANNSAGKVVSVCDEAGETRYEYGKLGEVTKETRTLKRHIPAYEDEKTAVMEYVSDYLGRMQRITYPDREVVSYGYDAGGQVCSITGVRDGQNYTYVADIGYDEYGQRVYIKYGNGVETNYTYDKDMRWLKHIDTQNTYGKQYQNIEYSFDDVGNVEKYTNDCMNGSRYRTEQTYTYDALYQLISATGTTEDNPYAIPGSPDYSSTYTQDFSFDAIGNMTHKKSEETITPAIQKKGGDDLNYEFTYQYDADYAHRLKRAGSEQKGWRYYTYDANGNVTSESDGVAPNEDTTTLTPVTVTTQTNAAGESVYEADYAWAWPWGGNGNSGKKPVPNNKRRYEWNSRNLLMRSVNSVYDTRYAYAADGNRAAKWTATKSSETLYFNTMWTWHTDKGLPEGQYSKHIYLGETRVVTKQTSKLEASYGQSDEWHHQYYYHPDHLGSAQLITDYEGNEYQRIEYTPYGELWVEKKTEKEEGLRYLPYKFTAKEQDEETGLYYYGARYLDAKYSRWLSTDPAVSDYIPMAPTDDNARKHNGQLPGQGGVFNVVNFQLYHYAGNNPVKYTDPDGKFTWAAIPFIIGIGLLFKTDTQPKATPINADAINNKLANIYYNDPSKLRGVFLSSPYTRENSESLTLESHPIVAFGCALPRGNYSESDYSNQNQMKDTRIEKTRTVLDGLNLASSIIQKLSDGHVGDITLTYKKGWGKITSWTLTLTTLDPVSGRSTGRQVFSREDALKYLNDNKEILKNDPAYKELKILLD
ncbi:RHS repeat domain-containing protein [Treponema sp. Marseille-Q4523]|uniref:RHS repeat domain-containing protein n=1 Tax=Treponema sp. Marseille-Q4523 TaxID=2810610 RepID=UPI001960B760|nr:RHS repeat-associated core domain-containing protein [Treponema sp. Marseille-Q4523]MBM7024177.1 RHS repeat-associated core domain-containing protein [Treponema sp. Marseille-Q4523]